MKQVHLQARLMAGDVKRWHTFPCHTNQTVAHHSYGVAQIVRLIADDYSRMVVPRLVYAALDHDIAEQQLGDIPYNMKSRLTGLKEIEQEIEASMGAEHLSRLTDEELEILKIADLLEAAWFARGELELGNNSMGLALANLEKGLDEFKLRPKAQALKEKIYEGLR